MDLMSLMHPMHPMHLEKERAMRRCLSARGGTPASHETREAPRSQGATTESIGQYSSEEQRRERGCIACRMQQAFHQVLLGGTLLALVTGGLVTSASSSDVDRLVAALLGPTPLADDLRDLSDRIGGRATGSDANARAVAWAEARLRAAGVQVRREAFTMPMRWVERSATAVVSGADMSFTPRVAAMPFSAA